MVTIIIPYQNTCPERERNFNFIVGNIKDLNIPCIVVEQVKESKPNTVDKNIRHIHLAHDGLFQKSKLKPQDCEYVPL